MAPDAPSPASDIHRPVGAGGSSSSGVVGRLVARLSSRWPELEVVLEHGTSLEILTRIHNGSLDAGFYNEAGAPDPLLATHEASQFKIYLAAPAGLVAASRPLDWRALAALPWIYPTSSACCGQTAESLFKQNQIRPMRIISVDREDVTRTLIAGGLGVGLLHQDTAKEAEAHGEVELLFESPRAVRVLFAHLASRAQDPLVVVSIAALGSAEG